MMHGVVSKPREHPGAPLLVLSGRHPKALKFSSVLHHGLIARAFNRVKGIEVARRKVR